MQPLLFAVAVDDGILSPNRCKPQCSSKLNMLYQSTGTYLDDSDFHDDDDILHHKTYRSLELVTSYASQYFVAQY